MSIVPFLRRLARWQKHALLLFAFAVVATPLVAHDAVSNRELSILDEWQYSERVQQVSQGDLFMRNGEIIGGWAQDARACRGIVRLEPPKPAPCRLSDPIPIPNSAASDPPPYFVVTGLVTGAALKTGITDNVITTGRLVGIGWAALSMWTLFLLSRAMGATRAASLVVSSAPLLVPAYLQQYTYITPHALDIPVGAFTALATLKFLRREWAWWTLVLAGLAVAGVKGSNVTIVVAVGIALLAIIGWPPRRTTEEGEADQDPPIGAETRRRALVAGVVLVVSTVVFTVGWMLVVGATQISEPAPPGNYLVDSLDTAALVTDSFRFLLPIGEGPLITPGVWLALGMSAAALAVWAGLARPQLPMVRQLAPGFLLGAALAPIVLDVMVFVTTDQYIGIQLRYGLALFPLGLAFLALLLRTRTSLVIVSLALLVYAASPALAGLDAIAM